MRAHLELTPPWLFHCWRSKYEVDFKMQTNKTWMSVPQQAPPGGGDGEGDGGARGGGPSGAGAVPYDKRPQG
jgi:hypothetical protein